MLCSLQIPILVSCYYIFFPIGVILFLLLVLLAPNVLNQLTHSPGIQATKRCVCLLPCTGLGQAQRPRAQPCGLTRVYISCPGLPGSRCSASSTRTFSRGQDVYNPSWRRFPSVTLDRPTDQRVNKLSRVGRKERHTRTPTHEGCERPAVVLGWVVSAERSR